MVGWASSAGNRHCTTLHPLGWKGRVDFWCKRCGCTVRSDLLGVDVKVNTGTAARRWDVHVPGQRLRPHRWWVALVGVVRRIRKARRCRHRRATFTFGAHTSARGTNTDENDCDDEQASDDCNGRRCTVVVVVTVVVSSTPAVRGRASAGVTASERGGCPGRRGGDASCGAGREPRQRSRAGEPADLAAVRAAEALIQPGAERTNAASCVGGTLRVDRHGWGCGSSCWRPRRSPRWRPSRTGGRCKRRGWCGAGGRPRGDRRRRWLIRGVGRGEPCWRAIIKTCDGRRRRERHLVDKGRARAHRDTNVFDRFALIERHLQPKPCARSPTRSKTVNRSSQ